MQTVAIWSVFVLAQSSRLFVGGVKARFAEPMPADSIEPMIISGFADKREGMIEPSCEELRAMWRYTKRQSRKADVASDFPMYPDPVSYNLWNVYPERTRTAYGGYRASYPGRQRSGAPPIYGRLVHKAPAGSRFRNGMPHRTKAFEDVAQLYGTVNHHPPSSRRRLMAGPRVGGGVPPPMYQSSPQSGRFQHLKDLIRTERARELQEQHAADELAARTTALKQMTLADDMPDVHQPRQRFSNALRPYQLPAKNNHDFVQSRYMPSLSDPGRAWTRNAHYPREYMNR